MEKQLWDSIFSESVAVPGRPEVFKWRGRVLLQPRMDDQGLCIILVRARTSHPNEPLRLRACLHVHAMM
jgi:hypothetical protein